MVHFDRAVADAHQAILLAPELGEGHRALGRTLAGSLEFARASEEYKRAVSLGPGNAQALQDYGSFAVRMGRTEAGVAAIRRAVLLDPLNRSSHLSLGKALHSARDYHAAIAAYGDALALDPGYSQAYAFRGLAQYALGDFQGARASCEMKTGDFVYYPVCLAITYDKLGQHTAAETMLAKLQRWMGDGDAYQYAEIYAQWGNTAQGLIWPDLSSGTTPVPRIFFTIKI